LVEREARGIKAEGRRASTGPPEARRLGADSATLEPKGGSCDKVPRINLGSPVLGPPTRGSG